MTKERDQAGVAAEIQAIHARLAALASDPGDDGVAAELGSIRAQLRELAEANEQVGDRLAESLGLRQPAADADDSRSAG
jgi:hypothetical protein